MDGIEDILEERSKTHGDFTCNAAISQGLKTFIRTCSPNAVNLTSQMQEALDVICGKIARILAGDPSYPDHWRDIAGYATLVQHILEVKEKENNSL